jgi:biopolymer transport protein ExbD
MKQSPRAKRMVRHRLRLSHIPKLNLVPLIDCFTLLIFFLLINYSADVEILIADKSVKLPISISDMAPSQALVVMINANDILVQGRRVGGVNEMMASTATKFAPLEAELKYLADKSTPLSDTEKAEGRPIKIMASCVAADYRNIALAVVHTEASISTGPGG